MFSVGGGGLSRGGINGGQLGPIGGAKRPSGGGGGGGGGGSERLAKLQEAETRSQHSAAYMMADAMKAYTQAGLDLTAQEKAKRDAAKQAVTSRLDAEARNLADTQMARQRAGVYAGDRGGTRKVRVTSNVGSLQELEDANYFAAQRKNLDAALAAEKEAAGTKESVWKRYAGKF